MVWAAHFYFEVVAQKDSTVRATEWQDTCCILARVVTREVRCVLFPSDIKPEVLLSASSTLIPNMGLPVHRWIRYIPVDAKLAVFDAVY